MKEENQQLNTAQALLNATHDLAYLLKQDGAIIDLNEAGAKRLKSSAAKLKGKNVFQFFPPDILKVWRAKIDEVFKNGQPVSFQDERAGVVDDNSIYPIFNSAGKVELIAVFVKDVTAERQNFSDLKESKEKLSLLFNNANDLIVTHDLKGKIISVNKKALSISGYSENELVGQDVSKLLTPESLMLVKKVIKDTLTGGIPPVLEVEARNKKGMVISLEETAQIIFENGKPSAIQVIARDITERKRMEKEKIENANKYLAIFNASPDGIIVVNQQAVVVDINEILLGWLGYKREALIGKNLLDFDFLSKETKAKIKDRWVARFNGQKIEPYEIEFFNQKGEKRIGLVKGNIIKKDGVKEDLVFISDITDKIANEQKQRELDERYKAIFNASPDVIVLLSQQGVILEVNDLVEKWLKYKKSEIIGKTLFELDFLTPESLKKVKEIWKRRFAGEKIESYEVEFFNKKNEIRIGLIEGNLVKNNDGKFIQDLVIISDITERKKMVETMKVEQENFKNIVNAQFESIVILDWKGKILFVNDATLKFGKYKSREEIVGKNGFSIIHPDSRLSMIKDLANTHLGKGGYLNEYKFIDAEGNTIYAESLGGLINYEGEERAFVTLRDITEKKKTEEALKTSQEKYVKLFESLGEGIVMVDMNGKIMECNPAYARLLGYSRDEVLKLTYQQLTPKKWEAMEMDIVKNEVMTKGVSDEYEKEYIKKDGSIITVVLKTWLIKNASNQPIGMWAIVRDVTKEKQGISELKYERDLAEKYFNTSPNLVVVLDRNQKVVAINQAGSQLLGYKTEDVVGKDWFANFVPAKDADGLRAKFMETVTTPKKKVEESFSVGWVNSVLTKSKEERQIEWQSSTIFDESGKFSKVISSGIDITERLKYEENLKEKVNELERINKLMVGREMKMVELKERIKELEQK